MDIRKILLILLPVFLLISCSKAMEYTSYEHYQTFVFSDFEYGLEILQEPLKKDILYSVQKGDKIEVTEFRVYKKQDCYLKVIIPSGEFGYIQFGKNNVYKTSDKGNFKYIDTVQVSSKKLWVLSFNETLGVNSDFLYSLPDKNSEKIYELTKRDKENYSKATAITNDFSWIKFNII